MNSRIRLSDQRGLVKAVRDDARVVHSLPYDDPQYPDVSHDREIVRRSISIGKNTGNHCPARTTPVRFRMPERPPQLSY
jgi:hypothetical protein